MTIINETTKAIQIGNTWGFGGGANIAKFFVCLALCCFFIFLLIWGIKKFDDDDDTSMLTVFVITVIISGLGVLAEAHTKPIYEYTPQYEILIDDTVTAKEFLDKYDLIDHRGEIFVVVEKTDN